MAETWDNKTMRGSDIQSALTQVYTDLNDKQDTCIYVVDSPDWNDLTETGFYEIKNSSTAGTDNSPEAGKMHCIVTKVVDNSNRAYINQIALGDYIYKRYKFENESWTTWKNIPYSAKFTSADSGKLVGIDANALLSTFNANVSDITNIANYNRVHVEAYRDNTGPNYPRYSKVGMYRYDSGTAVLVPQQTGSLGPGELVGAPEAILQQSNQNWNPTQFNCEDFLIVRNGYSVEVTDIFQLGNIVTSPSCRRFRIRFANLDSYDWLIRFCHTESNGTYSGSINIITNKLGRFDNFYEVKVRPKKCVLVDLIISTVGYNITEGIIVMIDTDEPDETT